MDRHPIVILVDSSQLGGIETHIYHLSRALRLSGWSAEIWFYQRYTTAHPLEPRFNAESIRYRYLKGSMQNLLSELNVHKPVLLHTHGYKAGIFGRLVALISKTPVVSTFHNGDPGEGIVRLYTWLDRITSKLSLNIAVSSEIADRFITPPVQINNFVNVSKSQMPIAKEKAIANKKQTGRAIAFVGRLSHEKGPDQFIQLAKHHQNLEFRLYGSGPMEQSLSQLQTDNVHFIGQVSGMNDQWHEIDLLCITSRHEGLPMVALEAMAHGIPVISFSLGALPQLIKQGANGWIAPVGDLKSMSRFIQLWRTLPVTTQQTVRSNCIETIKAAYSYEAVLPGVLNVYRQACLKAGYTLPTVGRSAKTPDINILGE